MQKQICTERNFKSTDLVLTIINLRKWIVYLESSFFLFNKYFIYFPSSELDGERNNNEKRKVYWKGKCNIKKNLTFFKCDFYIFCNTSDISWPEWSLNFAITSSWLIFFMLAQLKIFFANILTVGQLHVYLFRKRVGFMWCHTNLQITE